MRVRGLWRVMPITFWTMTAGILAIIGNGSRLRVLNQRTRSSRRVRQGRHLGRDIGIARCSARDHRVYRPGSCIRSSASAGTDDVHRRVAADLTCDDHLAVARSPTVGCSCSAGLQEWLTPSLVTRGGRRHTIQRRLLTVITLLSWSAAAVCGLVRFGASRCRGAAAQRQPE